MPEISLVSLFQALCQQLQNVPKSPKGAPAKSDDFVGRGGARERAEFSPQAETEVSGLCDDEEKEDAE